ncbi:MAG: helix-turn-helix domain-containing protein [Acutalibacteraceae bacterium]
MQWQEKLKKMKMQSGKTSQEISEDTGIPKSTIDKLFSGQTKEPYLTSIRAVVHCLGYTLDDLDDNPKLTSDIQKAKLIHNYESLNQAGKDKLVEYSEDLKVNPKYTEKVHKIKIAARNGRFEERTLTDSDIEKLKNLPDMDDDI